MDDVKINFIFNSNNCKMRCDMDTNIEDIIKLFIKQLGIDLNLNDVYFLYNGDIINEKYTIKEILHNNIIRNEMKILVNEYEDNKVENIELKDSKYIICPKCFEFCNINFNNYKINLNNCNEGHNFLNLLFNEFNDFQKINECNILCHKCKNSKNDSYVHMKINFLDVLIANLIYVLYVKHYMIKIM